MEPAPVLSFPTSAGARRRLGLEAPWVRAVDRGRFCHRHLSWLCGVGIGDCQRQFFSLLGRIPWRP